LSVSTVQVCKFSMTISLKFKVYLETSLRKRGIFSKYRIRKSDIFGPSAVRIFVDYERIFVDSDAESI